MTPDWRALERKVAEVVDDTGTPIDAGIAPLVAGLWAHGLTTDASCEGHLFDEPLTKPAYEDPYYGSFGPPPYVAIAADSRTLTRWTSNPRTSPAILLSVNTPPAGGWRTTTCKLGCSR